MKIIARIIVILIAALAVVGATLALSNSGALNGLLRAGRFEPEFAFTQRPGGAPGEFARSQGQRRQFDRALQQDREAGRPFAFEGSFERGRFGEAGLGSFNLFGAFELARNLIIVLVIVAITVAATLIWQRLGRRRVKDAPA